MKAFGNFYPKQITQSRIMWVNQDVRISFVCIEARKLTNKVYNQVKI